MIATELSQTPVGGYAPDFELPGTDRQVHHLGRYLKKYVAVGVVFMSNCCPTVQFYLDRLKQIQTDFQKAGFILIGINANDAEKLPEESFEAMIEFARVANLNFPYLRDTTGGDVVRAFGTQVTPEAFLIDKKGIIRYRGKIDDSAEDADRVKEPLFRNSISALLNGEKIVPSYTKAIGSLLIWC